MTDGETGRLGLDQRLPLRQGLAAALAGVVAYAEAMAQHCEEGPVQAVHEYRKAVRRSRAVVRLARPLLAPADFRALTRDLRLALRATSPLRDGAVLLATLDALTVSPRLVPARDALRRALEGDHPAEQDSKVELRRSAALLRGLPERFEAALPADVSWREVESALARSYRRVRAARRTARRSRDDADVHAFRKRVKELRYQLELLDAATRARPRRVHRALAALAEGLGEVTDLTLLRRNLRLREEELTVGSAPVRALCGRLDRLIDARLDRLLERSRRPLRRPPAKFAARVVRRFH